MKLTRSMRKRFKEERDGIFEKMKIEEDLQNDLRRDIENAKEDDEREEMQSKYDRSIANWELLSRHYATYDALASKPKFKVTPDTLLIVGGSLIEILLILNFEKTDIITSKALNYMLRKKV